MSTGLDFLLLAIEEEELIFKNEVGQEKSDMHVAPKRKSKYHKVKQPKEKKCNHGRKKYLCRDCKGGGICEHLKQKTFCKICKGSGICDHGNNRYICKECKKH